MRNKSYAYCSGGMFRLFIITAAVIVFISGCVKKAPATRDADAGKTAIIFVYCETMACQCMLDASKRMDDYLTSLVLTNAARSDMFVLERIDFRSARRFNVLTKQYDIQYAPALIVIATNGKPAYTVSGHFDMPDVERFDAALAEVAQKK